MAVKSDKVLLKKLKKQVRTLQRKEAQSRNKLRAALKKIRKLGRAHKTKLLRKARLMKAKIAETQAATYAKVAGEIENQLQKNIDAKSKSLQTALNKFEKKQIAKLRKSISKKGTKAAKVKKPARNAVIAPARIKKLKGLKGRKSGR
ncbi:hypothetical protein [Aquicella lusitana]|uniref:Uncharacterized protein n=1 Tax=Aquicella lusitana TaxID=254246 RepID=A0A370GM57_9COXI|nr:hypothetical protein [Aquicella lusitana]RDI44815.1 hypothetical protein C8D86_10869 [Aquicella lusitana]VVC73012.1 hypothetical protein AQULUS_07400 [Aquicella lusitana]